VTPRAYRSLQALILALTAAMLFGKISSGTLFFYINYRFLPLTLVGIAGLLWLAQALYGGHRHAEGHSHEEVGAGVDGGSPEPRPPLRNLLLLCVPLVLGTAVPAQPLGSSAIATKGLTLSAPAPVGGGAPITVGVASEERTVLDWIRLFSESDDPSAHAGQAADVIGFVYPDPRLPAGSFLLARFTLACCVADAFAIGVAVEWPQAETLAPGTWVRARGPVAVGEIEGHTLPRILAASVEPIDAPDQPYLFP
jgi:uncharacterized repeat protein (TIGR03943 family)